jgi:hypothetical protein
MFQKNFDKEWSCPKYFYHFEKEKIIFSLRWRQKVNFSFSSPGDGPFF